MAGKKWPQERELRMLSALMRKMEASAKADAAKAKLPELIKAHRNTAACLRYFADRLDIALGQGEAAEIDRALHETGATIE